MNACTDNLGTLVYAVDDIRVTRHHTMGQTWWMVSKPDQTATGWYSKTEALRSAKQ